MTPSRFTVLALIIAAMPSPMIAQDAGFTSLSESYQLAQSRDYNDVVSGLQATDYMIEDVTTTLLGRTLITANNGTQRREVVVSRSTGEILSDVVMDLPIDQQSAAWQAARAANGPTADETRSGIQFGGSVTVGINNQSGGYGQATLTARQDNIGGSNVSGAVSLSKGIE